MTDEIIRQVSVEDRAGRGSMLILCTPNAQRVVFRSDLFLSTSGNRQIEARLDDAKSGKVWALANGKDAIIYGEMPTGKEIARMGKEALLRAIDGPLFFGQVAQPLRRLRIRLTAFNEESRDLDFDMTGFSKAMASFYARCEPAAAATKAP